MSQLKVDSIVPVGGVPAGADGGGIIQVVQTRSTTNTAYSNVAAATTYDLYSTNITPRSTSSKILVMASFHIWMQHSSATTMYGNARLRRGTTDLYTAPGAEEVVGNISEWGHRINVQWLDSPATTSQITYTVRWTHDSPGPITYLTINRNGSPGVLTLLEISG